MKKNNQLLTLFLTMFKIGLFTFGGGYAMIALLENEFIEKRNWIDKEEFLNMAAIAESTPGPIAINAATYIGYKLLGFLGAVVSTFAISLPSFAIIFAVSLFFDKFLSFKWVAYAFKGIQVCVIYLIISAGLKMLKTLKKTAFNISVLILVTGFMIAFSLLSVDFSAIYYILICGFAGVLFANVRKLSKKEEEK